MNDSLRGAIRSKMIWIGLALTVFGFLQTQSEVLSRVVPEDWMGVVNMLFGLAVVVLRFLTTDALSDKAP